MSEIDKKLYDLVNKELKEYLEIKFYLSYILFLSLEYLYVWF